MRYRVLPAGILIAALAVMPLQRIAATDTDDEFTEAAAVSDLIEAAPVPMLESEQSPDVEIDSRSSSVALYVNSQVVSIEPVTAEGEGVEAPDGAVVTIDESGAFASMLVAQESAAQVTIAIAGHEAPARYQFRFGGDVAVLRLAESGEVATYDVRGELIGAVEQPWAFDAEGSAVDTYYEVEGLTLVQVVEHWSDDVVYPVVADPTWSGKVLWKATMSDYLASNPGRKLTAHVSAYGRMILGEGRLTQFRTEGWSLLLGSFAGYMPVGSVRSSMDQQWRCHVIGHLFEQGTFDMETARPSNPNWASRIGTVWPASQVCNW